MLVGRRATDHQGHARARRPELPDVAQAILIEGATPAGLVRYQSGIQLAASYQLGAHLDRLDGAGAVNPALTAMAADGKSPSEGYDTPRRLQQNRELAAQHHE